MSFAYLALYTGDYLRDTRACSMAEHGAYLLLLIHCWDTREPVPLDEREAAGICNARSGDELEAMRRVLRRYFVKMTDGWYNRRMQREIERAENISQGRSEAGKKGYEARAKQLLGKSKARAKQLHLPPPPPPSLPLSPPPGGEALALSPAGIRAAASARVIAIPLNDGSEFGVDAQIVTELERLYPDVHTSQTLNEIRAWNLTNPTKRKTKAGVLRHINAWFAREQNR